MELKGTPARILNYLVRAWTRPVLHIRSSSDHASISVFPDQQPTEGIDERIARIEIAKQLLLQAVSTIDELREQADSNKQELQVALAQLGAAGGQRDAVKEELNELRKIASADIQVFQKLAGVPSPKQIRRERLLGFLLGVLASVLASVIWWLFTTKFQLTQ